MHGHNDEIHSYKYIINRYILERIRSFDHRKKIYTALNNLFISRLSVVPIRSKPDLNAPLVSQLLFGERVEQLSKKVGFRRVRCLSDDTIGWVSDLQLVRLKKQVKSYHIAGDIFTSVLADGLSTYITIGGELPDYDGMTARINGEKYHYSGAALDTEHRQPDFTLLDKMAKRLLNAPYLRGGRSPFGLDADGYVQIIYRCVGICLPRYMEQQIICGENVDFIETARPGDLIFFKNKEVKVSHVGILLEDNKIIHVYGHVRVDHIDHHGIFDKKRRKYTHTLRTIRRVLP